MKVVAGLVVLAIVAVVGFVLYGQHQRALAFAEASRDAECRSIREAVQNERGPDGSLPNDNRSLQINFDVCVQEGR